MPIKPPGMTPSRNTATQHIPRAMRRAIDDGIFQYGFLYSKGMVVAAGTTEVMKNIIGERVLGLPKDMARSAITRK